ncbi:BlaI/MecI/CopY family transcriptional regulator [Saxibacter everestensis]|uniref:BlaI/MecI/CopY family transcriptional regulator n=1 Tax=Saxibacter everestensis TaxID=2909229 RepID=A0ABY8QWD5_9MICO|nr:BlaI/MecI/CopY family transcriptional regulator [Brevibacteriaceae bacterium ZFBP1038]
MGTLGELERSAMDVLWSAESGLSATELRDALADRDLALTTVHTVLSRLEAKNFVVRERSVRPHRYQAASSREEHVAELMHEVLGQAPDREAVLARFIGSASNDETDLLRRLLTHLDPRSRRTDRPAS